MISNAALTRTAGPAISIDTACSSALVTAHMGAQHLANGGIMALTAGINLLLAESSTAATQVSVLLECFGTWNLINGEYTRFSHNCITSNVL